MKFDFHRTGSIAYLKLCGLLDKLGIQIPGFDDPVVSDLEVLKAALSEPIKLKPPKTACLTKCLGKIK